MPIKVAMLELHSRSVGRFRDEAHLDLARLLEVGLHFSKLLIGLRGLEEAVNAAPD